MVTTIGIAIGTAAAEVPFITTTMFTSPITTYIRGVLQVAIRGPDTVRLMVRTRDRAIPRDRRLIREGGHPITAVARTIALTWVESPRRDPTIQQPRGRMQ